MTGLRRKSLMSSRWVLTRFDDVKRALNDRVLSADQITPFLNHPGGKERLRVAQLGAMVQRWAGSRPGRMILPPFSAQPW